MKAANRLQLLGYQVLDTKLTTVGSPALITPEKIGDDQHQYNIVIDFEPERKVKYLLTSIDIIYTKMDANALPIIN